MPYRAYICIYHSSGGLAAGRRFFVLDETKRRLRERDLERWDAGQHAAGGQGLHFLFSLCPARL